MATSKPSSKRYAERGTARPPRPRLARPARLGARRKRANPRTRAVPLPRPLARSAQHARILAVPLDPRLNEGVALFNRQQFFACHDVLERVWLQASGPAANFYKGLIQAAVAFHHWSKGNLPGAMSLYRSSIRYLKRYRPECAGLDLEPFLQRYTELFGWLRRHRTRYDGRLVPMIRWVQGTTRREFPLIR